MIRTPRLPPFREALIGVAAWVAIGLIVYAAFEAGLIRPGIRQKGSVTATSILLPRRTVTARTRELAVRHYFLWQVEVSPNEWKDCGTDCAETLRRFAFQE